MLYSATITDPGSGTFAVVDLGSTKIVCFIVRISHNNDFEIVGIGYKAAEGISGGAIIDIESAKCSILSCIESAKEMAQEPVISQVFVNVSGCDISSMSVVNEIDAMMHEVSDVDIRNIMLQTYDKCRDEQVVLHNIPVVYRLDDLNNITELKGLYGSKLKASMHVVTASKSALLNIENCITNCSDLNVVGCVAEPYTSGLSCLADDEKELGSMVVDIGGRYTSIGIFSKGKLMYTDSIPLGGIHITNDIAYGLCISVKDAERIKVLYGDAMLVSPDKNGIIEADVGEDEVISVVRSDLGKIIRLRVEEIFDIVKSRVVKQKHLINKIIITGGSSQLTNVKEVASNVFKRQVRIGLPVELKGITDDYKYNPSFSAAIGTVLLVVNRVYGKKKTMTKKGSILQKILKLVSVKVENSV
ncbi:cell division protein FtsA [Ehrlichia chaffeensis str. Heartland]|uniref:Cell division protein FtsA n=1 Tax=Ehrlichia chaffeensis (strain ATCC CRL-10679 / Arkansas) TaxID=205920 RepID=Q2GFA8_EHRCR|nr:cell division protein FtsA [Ehrlichia chaffeensis]ABD44720.1 cell division protein FtsA [Ehrlichia chaffeensis str. Arkansas]AHX03262.1 cell division protein FtsA [Ehrlichia chaffeensis str. Heartland]AHX05179.1 cell division protein FtsA [Ehrlichia chaffeensis str. Jax]AHX06168.1 cell division protein FtsA [Ehrlichia chaffeensis str. Liberty]AHX07082.1 cell division protein FtsA [Ehrlichia chaffeensis str. Osceola]